MTANTPLASKQKVNHYAKVNLYIQRGLIYGFLAILSVLALFAFYIMIVNSSRPHAQILSGFSPFFGSFWVENFKSMVGDTNNRIFQAMWNSFLIAILSAFLSTYFSAFTAYGIHMYRFKGRKFLFVFILIVMMIPGQVATLGLIELLYKVKLVDNYLPLIVPSIAAPAVFFFMKQYLDSILPHEVVESARMDGANELKIFHQIVLPMIKPALAVQFIFAFVGSWNNFFMPAVLITSPSKRTLPLLIAELRVPSNPATFNLGMVYMMLSFAIIPLLLIYFIFSKHIIKGVTLGSVKG